MLRKLVLCMSLIVAAPIAWADAKSECSDWENTSCDRRIVTCSEVIGGDAGAAWAYGNRGIAYWAKHAYNLAFADYTKAIELDPKDADAYCGRASGYEKKGDMQRAKADRDAADKLEGQEDICD